MALEDATYVDATSKVRVDIGGAQVKVTHTAGGQAQTNVGDQVFVDGAQAVDLTGGMTDQVPAGHIAEIASATVVWVQLKPFGVVA